jgi:hypothetical protein
VHQHLAGIVLVQDGGRTRSHVLCRLIGIVVGRGVNDLSAELVEHLPHIHLRGYQLRINGCPKMSKKPTCAINRTGPGRRGGPAQPADVWPPKTWHMQPRTYPDSDPVLRRCEALADDVRCRGAAGWGWGGGVALQQQRKRRGSKSARSILLSLTCGVKKGGSSTRPRRRMRLRGHDHSASLGDVRLSNHLVWYCCTWTSNSQI